MSDAPTAAHQAELLKASTADHHATTLEAYADAMEKRPTEQLVARQVEAMVIKACRAGAAALCARHRAILPQDAPRLRQDEETPSIPLATVNDAYDRAKAAVAEAHQLAVSALAKVRRDGNPATPNAYHALQKWADLLPLESRDLFWQDLQCVIGRREGEGPTDCNICRKSQHAKWHDESKGEIINPIALLQFVDSLRNTEEVQRVRNWIAVIAQIQWATALPLSASPTPEETTVQLMTRCATAGCGHLRGNHTNDRGVTICNLYGCECEQFTEPASALPATVQARIHQTEIAGWEIPIPVRVLRTAGPIEGAIEALTIAKEHLQAKRAESERTLAEVPDSYALSGVVLAWGSAIRELDTLLSDLSQRRLENESI